jgi:sigma-B regulation protein RsbU (phosphoserine phosphatase)
MAMLITLQGPEAGRKFSLEAPTTIVGRQLDCPICLSAKAVSRQHAQILLRDGSYLLEDLDSSNGTFLNGKRLSPHVPAPFTERDTLQVGPYVFALRPAPTPATTETDLVIREQVNAVSVTESVYATEPAVKLQVVLEIAQHLARTLELEPLLDKLLDHLMRLFPQADRGMVLLCEGERLVVSGQRCRRPEDASSYPYSRTVVRRALAEGVGILSDDVRADRRFQASATITSLDLHTLLCVPLIGQDGKRLGVIQMDRFRQGLPFRSEDLQLLTAVAMQVAVVLENAHLHAELMREERFRQELHLAREIQQGYLPSEFEGLQERGVELFARVQPAREVSGDLYDYVLQPDGRLAFYIGDVSGKGMPAALFMVAVRTLARHLVASSQSPAATLTLLNTALAADNPGGMFVTLAHGIYTPATGEIALASAGHPLPLVRRTDGRAEEIDHRTGRLLGYQNGDLHLADARLNLAPGELLVFYTDGVTEAREPETRTLFGLERLSQVVSGFRDDLSLAACADHATQAVEEFTRTKDLQDDLTLLLLRRPALGEPATALPLAAGSTQRLIDQTLVNE